MKRITLLLLIAIVFSACRKEIDIKFPEQESKLVLNSLFNNTDTLSLDLSNSKSVLEATPIKKITNATVDIYENGILKAQLNNAINGMYKFSSIVPKPGNTYEAKIKAPGYKDISAHSYLPLEKYADSINISKNMQQIFIRMTDDGSTKNYYGVLFYYQSPNDFGQLYNDSDNNNSDVEQINNGEYIFTDEIFNGKTYEFYLNVGKQYNNYLDSTIFFMEVRHYSEDAYKYLKTQYTQSINNGNPFAEPVRVHNNIDNGFGIFAGYTTTIKRFYKLK